MKPRKMQKGLRKKSSSSTDTNSGNSLFLFSLVSMHIGFPDSSTGKESDSWVGKMLWRRDRLPTPVFLSFPGGSAGKESTCKAETWVLSLGWEDPLEKGKGTQSSILAWRIPWTPWGCKESDTTEQLSLHLLSAGSTVFQVLF